MQAIELHRFLTAQPFVPFHISTRRAIQVTVRSPQDALLTRSELIIVTERGADGIAESVLSVPLTQIARVQSPPSDE